MTTPTDPKTTSTTGGTDPKATNPTPADPKATTMPTDPKTNTNSYSSNDKKAGDNGNFSNQNNK